MDIYTQIASRIIENQRAVIGPLAIRQAIEVTGLKIVDEKKMLVQITGDGKGVIDNLVSRYFELFGQASVEVCKDAVSDIRNKYQPEDFPNSLK